MNQIRKAKIVARISGYSESVFNSLLALYPSQFRGAAVVFDMRALDLSERELARHYDLLIRQNVSDADINDMLFRLRQQAFKSRNYFESRYNVRIDSKRELIEYVKGFLQKHIEAVVLALKSVGHIFIPNSNLLRGLA